MDEPFISSDPHAFLCSYWRGLHEQSAFFANLAPELQAQALADAIAADHPAKAAEIRDWNAVTRRAMIAGLDQSLREKHAAKQVELWRLRKGDRELVCVAVYVSTGIELRLLEAGEIRRTELFQWGHVLQARARKRRAVLVKNGWHE